MASDAASYRTENPSALPPGTRLGEFELQSLLGVGGFGIVYLAFDHALEREVAVKEYMPASLAGRTETMHVSIRSHSDAENFALGLKSFVNEAKLLARFDHPSLLKVHRFWEANGTAYMAMPVLRGRTIKEARGEMGGPPGEAWLRGVLLPLLGAIEKLHSEGVYHRDIAPDNIQIEPDGRPVLLDFGAARRVLSDKTQSLTAILKPAYAPIEQYGEAGSVKQGPWTDLYALGATLHYVLMGRPPPPATARTVDDEHSALTVEALPGCSERFLRIIDWMLCPRPADRPQSVAELREVLEGRAQLPLRGQAHVRGGPAKPWERTDVFPQPPQRPGRVDLDVGDGATQIVRPRPPDISAVDLETADVPQPAAAPLQIAADRPAPASVSRRSPLPLVLVLGGVAALAAAAFLFWPKAEAPQPLPAQAPAASAVALPAPPAASAAQPVAVPASAAAAVAEAASAPSIAASAESALPTVVVPPPAAAEPTRPSGKAEKAERTAKPERKPQDAVKPRPEQAARPAEPATPGPICGTRGDIRYLVCMDRECGSAEFASHPACQRWRSEAKKD